MSLENSMAVLPVRTQLELRNIIGILKEKNQGVCCGIKYVLELLKQDKIRVLSFRTFSNKVIY